MKQFCLCLQNKPEIIIETGRRDGYSPLRGLLSPRERNLIFTKPSKGCGNKRGGKTILIWKIALYLKMLLI
jgi:hypothetical protein